MQKFDNNFWNSLIIHKFIHKFKNKNLCIFAHYDKHDIIDEHVIFYIKSLYAEDFDVIFVSTCENMQVKELNKLRDITSAVIIRKNVGYDFGSYKTGLIQCQDISNYNSLIITNDSIFAPILPLASMITSIKNTEYDICGMTDNYEISYHIQSYFVYFTKKVITDKKFIDFFNKIEVLENKQDIIEKYEIGLSIFYSDLGFKLGAIGAYDNMKAYHKNNILNSTLYFWDILIKENKVPMIKVELIRDNPNKVNISQIEQFIVKNTNYDFNLIKNYLRRIK